MTHNSNGRQTSSHVRLTPARVKDLWQQGDYSSQGYLHHLILAHRKPGWTWRIDNVAQFCKDWEINRRTFYRAKAILIRRGIIIEERIGGIALKVIDTDVCIPLNIPVSETSQVVPKLTQAVPELTQPVPTGSHVSAKTLELQHVCDSTDLNKFKTTTIQSECVRSDVNHSEMKNSESDIDTFDQNPPQVKPPESPKKAIPLEKETYAPPILLSAKKKFGINLDDTKLRQAIETWPERLDGAIACLQEKERTVNYPTRFLVRAIEDNWKPEKPTGGGEWREWFNQAYDRGLVKAGRGVDGIQYVLTSDEHWVPFEHLRRQSWEELEAQLKPITVEAYSTADTLTPGQAQIIEAMAVLVEGTAHPDEYSSVVRSLGCDRLGHPK